MDNRDLKAKFLTGVADAWIWAKANKAEAITMVAGIWAVMLMLILVLR